MVLKYYLYDRSFIVFIKVKYKRYVTIHSVMSILHIFQGSTFSDFRILYDMKSVCQLHKIFRSFFHHQTSSYNIGLTLRSCIQNTFADFILLQCTAERKKRVFHCTVTFYSINSIYSISAFVQSEPFLLLL